jgi:cell division protein FtsN
VAGDARATGLEVRIVRVEGSDLVRVRYGAYATREEAEAQARVLRDLGFEAVISSDRNRETAG